ncbi:glycosyltransferase family 39 protein [Rhizobium sp. OAE497]|uniref:glycosyltransferase family 39 protein n=1 Tax=Rhizobium sp. OAE497 TaxID=2663796 RepID=UPI0018F308C9
MVTYLRRNPDGVLWLLAVYLAVQAAFRIFVSNSLSVDESQQVFFGQWLSIGYNTQPPLYNWLQYAVFAVFGISIASVAILKNIMLFISYLCYYRLSREVLKQQLFAVIATLGFFTIPQMFWQAQKDLTHTVSLLIAITLSIHLTIRILKSPSTLSYVLLGFAVAAGMLSKYNFALVVLAILVAVLMHPEGLRRLLDKRFLLTIAISVVLFLPHGLWILRNPELASDATLSMMSADAVQSRLAQILEGLKDLATTSFAIAAPTTLFLAIIFGRDFVAAFKARSDWSRFFTRFYATILAALLVMILVMTLTEFRDRWLFPFLFLLPLLICLKLEAADVKAEDYFAKFLVLPIVMLCLLPFILTGGTMLAGVLGKYGNLNRPYARFVEAAIAKEGKQPSLIVTERWHDAGNVKLAEQAAPVIVGNFPGYAPAATISSDHPALLIFNTERANTEPLSAQLQEWLSAHPELNQTPVKQTLDIRYLYGKEDATYPFTYVWVYPAAP